MQRAYLLGDELQASKLEIQARRSNVGDEVGSKVSLGVVSPPTVVKLDEPIKIDSYLTHKSSA